MDEQPKTTWTSSLKKSIGLRQAHHAAMLEDVTQGLKLERDKERALHRYHGIDLPPEGEEMIHVGDVNISNSPGAATQSSADQRSASADSSQSSATTLAPKRTALAAAVKYLGVAAAIAAGGGVAVPVAYMGAKLIGNWLEKPAAPTAPPAPMQPVPPVLPGFPGKDWGLRAIDD